MANLFRDVVVLIPGILGTTLRRGDKEIWGLSSGTILRAVLGLGSSVAQLELASDDADDGVTVGGLLPDAHLIPGFWKVDGYGRIASYLCDELGLVRKHNYHEFPYDWRRDNRYAGEQLALLAPQWLRRWERLAGPGAPPRLIIIGHSMGGLVARHFLEMCDGWKLTKALITFGTPHRGSLDALNVLSNGLKVGRVANLTTMARSLPSLHQLLPIYPCIDDGSGLKSIFQLHASQIQVPGIDPVRYDKALRFHRDIEGAVSAREGQSVVSPYAIHSIVGNLQPTLQSARLANGALEMLETYPGQDIAGDGTVPQVSAIPIELAGQASVVFSSERHASLQNALHVLAHVQGVLTADRIDLGMFRGLRKGPQSTVAGLALRIPDAVEEGQPLPISVRLSSGSRLTVSVSVIDVDRGDSVPVALRPTPDGEHVGEARLAVGVYRVQARAHGEDGIATPVSDLTVVLPKKEAPAVAVPIEWDPSVAVIDGRMPAESALDALRSTGAHSLVIDRPGYGMYAFDAAETVERAIHAKAGQTIIDAFDLHEDGRSERRDDGPAIAALTPLSAAPSAARLVQVDPSGTLRVGRSIEPFTTRGVDGWGTKRGPALGGASPATVTVERAPKIDGTRAVPGEPIEITVDLVVPTGPSKVVSFAGVPAAWQRLDVEVRIVCPDLDFGGGATESSKTVTIGADGSSVACRFGATVRADTVDGGELRVVVMFLHEGRSSGVATWIARVEAKATAVLAEPPTTKVRTAVAIAAGAPAPILTVHVLRMDPSNPGQLLFTLHVADRTIPGLPTRWNEVVNIGASPQAVLKDVVSAAGELLPGRHMPWFLGLGKQLYGKTPKIFQQAYAALAARHTSFPIQFVLDDPYVPWELMSVNGKSLLCMDHPVARWMVDQEGIMRPDLLRGTIATTAPDYRADPRWTPLPFAQSESRKLCQELGAVPVAGTRAMIEALLSGKHTQSLAVIHFACHGEFTNAIANAIVLEDGKLSALEIAGLVDSQKRGPFVVFNACEVGATADLLGTGFGFAGAFIAAGFSGYLAPLWPVIDRHAADHVVALLDQVVTHRRPVASALQELRARDGITSPTVLAYVYFGDVMAAIPR